MAGENNAPETQQSTPVTQGVETQQSESQSVQQADTTQTNSQVNQEMGITQKEPENSEPSQLSIDDLVNQALKGELTDEAKKLIEENGLGKHFDLLVDGHKAVMARNDQEIFSVVGGEKAYSELQEWGANNLSEEEQQAFNEALFSGNMNLAKLAVQGLKAKYQAVNGKDPERVIEGGGSANADNRPFTSQMDYIRETMTVDYKRNPEHRAKVEAKRQLSGF